MGKKTKKNKEKYEEKLKRKKRHLKNEEKTKEKEKNEKEKGKKSTKWQNTEKSSLTLGPAIRSPKSDSSALWTMHPAGVLYEEGNGIPLRYSCLENPMDGGAWKAAVHGFAEHRTRLSNFTFTFHFHALEKEMATHSSALAWRIPGTGEPRGLPSMGLHRVGHD